VRPILDFIRKWMELAANFAVGGALLAPSLTGTMEIVLSAGRPLTLALLNIAARRKSNG